MTLEASQAELVAITAGLIDSIGVRPLDGLAIALIALGIALICGALIWNWRKKLSQAPIEETEETEPDTREENASKPTRRNADSPPPPS